MPDGSRLREGWGLARGIYNGKKVMFASDGTDNIYILDPDSWK